MSKYIPKCLTTTLLVILQIHFCSTLVFAQPLANPSLFATGNDWVGLLGFLFFSSPVAWAILSSLGDALGEKAKTPSLTLFLRRKFPAVGVVAYVVLVFYMFCKWGV